MSTLWPLQSQVFEPARNTIIFMNGQFQVQPGTYMKVSTIPSSPRPELDDAYRILYLRPSGTFLFLGYWSGFERTSVVGRWSRTKTGVELRGHGVLSPDSVGHNTPPAFRRVLTLSDESFTPTLVASTELPGWSLLGWAGNYSYAGSSTVVDPDGMWLPSSIDAVDAWIDWRLQDRLSGVVTLQDRIH